MRYEVPLLLSGLILLILFPYQNCGNSRSTEVHVPKNEIVLPEGSRIDADHFKLGDAIINTNDLKYYLNSPDSKKSRFTVSLGGTLTADPKVLANKWTEGKIYFVFHRDSFFDEGPNPQPIDPEILDGGKEIIDSFEAAFKSACQVWSYAANIKCLEKPANYSGPYLSVQGSRYDPSGGSHPWTLSNVNSRGCYASVGMSSGGNILGLEKQSCFASQILVHEIGHVLGFIHEHQRPDRSTYIMFNQPLPSCASGGWSENDYLWDMSYCDQIFDTLGSSIQSQAYDVESVMHYHKWAGSSIDPQTGSYRVTMKPLKEPFLTLFGNGNTLWNFGQWKATDALDPLSDGDKAAAKVFYGDPTETMPTDCPNQMQSGCSGQNLTNNLAPDPDLLINPFLNNQYYSPEGGIYP